MNNRQLGTQRFNPGVVLRQAFQYAAYLWVNTPVYGLGKIARILKKRPLKREAIQAEHIRSILVVRVDGLGDAVLMSAFLQDLRAGFPNAWITLVVDKKVLSFVELCPWVNEAVGIDERGSKYKRLCVGWLRAWRTAFNLRKRREYDLAINPRWDVDSRAASLIGYYSFAPYHVGFSERVNENKRHINRGLDRLFSHLIDSSSATLHEEDRNQEVLSHLGLICKRRPPTLWLSEEDKSWAARVLRDAKVDGNIPLVCFGIGGVELKRLWPIERFGELASWLSGQFKAAVVVIGDARDRIAADQMLIAVSDVTILNVAGVCSMRQSAAVLQRCDLFVGNDSGPMHLAAAASVPVVEISCHPSGGSVGHVNSPTRYQPRHVPSRAIQPPSRREPCPDGCEASEPHCILDISVDGVKEAVTELLAEVQLLEHRRTNRLFHQPIGA